MATTRKIKEAKDLSSGELIYFKGHAKATYMTDGRTVEDAINNINQSGNGGEGSSSNSNAYSLVNHGTSDTTFTLTPNTLHIWDDVSSLTLDLGTETSGVANEYLFQFTSGATATTLALPDNIKWSDEFIIEANKIYQISILNGLGTVMSWDI